MSAEEHERYLHNFGNLSITFDNATLGNHGFLEKRQLLADRSRVRRNQMLLDYETFGPEEIRDRCARLVERFFEAYEVPDLPWASSVHPHNAGIDMSPQQWLDNVRARCAPPELVGVPVAKFWSDICAHLDIHVGGNSARRALDRWRAEQRPNWPSPMTDND